MISQPTWYIRRRGVILGSPEIVRLPSTRPSVFRTFLQHALTYWQFEHIGIIWWYNMINVTINDFSVKHMTAHRCAGGLKKFDLRSGSHAIDTGIS